VCIPSPHRDFRAALFANSLQNVQRSNQTGIIPRSSHSRHGRAMRAAIAGACVLLGADVAITPHLAAAGPFPRSWYESSMWRLHDLKSANQARSHG